MKFMQSKISGIMLVFGGIFAVLFISPQPAHAQTGTALYSFGTPPDGSEPRAALIMDSKGNLYSTTNKGGANGVGAVFELSPEIASGCAAGTGAGDGWCESVLYSFGNGSEDAAYPDAALLLYKGDLYGTTYSGGAPGGPNCSFQPCGTVFKLGPKPKSGCPTGTNTGNGWCESVLYSFDSQPGDGFNPYAGLIVDKEGNLYGTTPFGGISGGTVFELSPEPASGCPTGSYTGNGWCETVLYAFGGEPDGGNPYGGVIIDKEGNLYGTTAYGGINGGTVFKLMPEPASGCATGSNTGNVWCETVLYRFGSQSGDGENPYGGLVIAGKGNLYGTTYAFGANTWGTVFEVTPTGEETTLHNFGAPPLGGNDGCDPFDSLIRDSSGNLYGDTETCGQYGGGNVFELSPPPPTEKGAAWTYAALYDFHECGDTPTPPCNPVAAVILEGGNLYLTLAGGGSNGNGAVFEVSP
jgi:uncharacterized repeat protein (TIGR03803 family)